MTRFRWRRRLGWILLVSLTLSLAACAVFKPKVEPLSSESKAPPRKVAQELSAEPSTFRGANDQPRNVGHHKTGIRIKTHHTQAESRW